MASAPENGFWKRHQVASLHALGTWSVLAKTKGLGILHLAGVPFCVRTEFRMGALNPSRLDLRTAERLLFCSKNRRNSRISKEDCSTRNSDLPDIKTERNFRRKQNLGISSDYEFMNVRTLRGRCEILKKATWWLSKITCSRNCGISKNSVEGNTALCDRRLPIAGVSSRKILIFSFE